MHLDHFCVRRYLGTLPLRIVIFTLLKIWPTAARNLDLDLAKSNPMSELDIFREETREFLEQHCPQSMRNQHFHWEDAHEYYDTDDARAWLQAMAARGWTAPAWPKEYTGGGLDPEHRAVLSQEMSRIKALPPSTGMGLSMIGPTLLELGTEEQKQRHLPKIVSGEINWCQGYSEPGAGSDLAALQTKAVIDGDNFVSSTVRKFGRPARTVRRLDVRAGYGLISRRRNMTALVSFYWICTNPASRSNRFSSSPVRHHFARRSSTTLWRNAKTWSGELNKGWTVGKTTAAVRAIRYRRTWQAAPATRKRKNQSRKSMNSPNSPKSTLVSQPAKSPTMAPERQYSTTR